MLNSIRKLPQYPPQKLPILSSKFRLADPLLFCGYFRANRLNQKYGFRSCITMRPRLFTHFENPSFSCQKSMIFHTFSEWVWGHGFGMILRRINLHFRIRSQSLRYLTKSRKFSLARRQLDDILQHGHYPLFQMWVNLVGRKLWVA